MKITNRSLLDIRNDTIRTRENIKALQGDLFTDEDRKILFPRYEQMLRDFVAEEKAFRLEVVDAETLTP